MQIYKNNTLYSSIFFSELEPVPLTSGSNANPERIENVLPRLGILKGHTQ